MSPDRFFDRVDGPPRSLVVLNRTEPRAVQSMLDGLFDDQPVTVDEAALPEAGENVVALLEDGAVVATSPLQTVADAILYVNTDLYTTGTRGIEDEATTLPAVLDGLTEVPFRMRGYPIDHKEKLLLVAVSRHIERLAYCRDAGRLRSSFQHLSRIDDERGTRTVYERLAAGGADLHVYGLPDWTPPPDLDLTMHGGYSEPFRDAWFVVYTPTEPEPSVDAPTDPVREREGELPSHAALLALAEGPHTWRGFWTYDPELVADLNRHVERRL